MLAPNGTDRSPKVNTNGAYVNKFGLLGDQTHRSEYGPEYKILEKSRWAGPMSVR
tara:strand:- start:583 stop:747 length:165 start_codon:yes stop_codon:yes gene_type:complete